MHLSVKRVITLFFLTFLGTASIANAMTVDELAAQFEAYKQQQAVELEKIRQKNEEAR